MGCWINVWVERNATCYLARKRLSFFLFRVMMMLKKIAYEMERTRSKFSCFLNVPVKRHGWMFWHLPAIYLKNVCDCDRALCVYGEHVLIHNNTWFSFIALLIIWNDCLTFPFIHEVWYFELWIWSYSNIWEYFDV